MASWREVFTREGAVWSLVVMLLASMPSQVQCSRLEDQIQNQKFALHRANLICTVKLANTTAPTDVGVYCEPVWDNIMCWPYYVKAGENSSQPCPTYIEGFNPYEKATRSCQEDGTWEKHPSDKINNSWTNFRNCLKTIKSSVPAVIEEHMPIVVKISTIGYSLSLCTLVVATAIMAFFKKLHCQRNTIHINLFISFMLRAIICLLRDSLLVQHLALPSDVKYGQDGTLVFIQEGMHWECKLLNTLWQYSLNANYMWIFVEGLYLHTLIFFAIFSQSSKFFKLYIIIGWVLPLIFIICWVAARIFKNNTLCWNTDDKGFYWILNAPIVSSISVNFFFFLNIMRVLFTKIRDCNVRDPGRYRKLAKSTLVLIPLFGVYYIFFIALGMYQEPKVAVIHMYMEMTLNSFQGTVVALLFCFLNGEVRSEIKKKWHRHWLRRQSIVSGRSTWAFSTSSFYMAKDRHSVSYGHPLCDAVSKEENSPSHHQPNGRMFHKVLSMPKLSQASYQNIKSMHRVSSSPKVTYRSTQDVIDVTIALPFNCEDRNSQNYENEELSNGGSIIFTPSKSGYLLHDNLDEIHEENITTVQLSKTLSHKDLPVGGDSKVKFRGINQDGRSVLIHAPNELPPLLDED